MVLELEKAQVTELQVRMNCNGCVQKIKKAIRRIDGVYDVSIDFAQQKLTVAGRADPEKIVKAIKKTRKVAIICSHTDAGEPGSSEQPPAEPEASSNPPVAPNANQPPSEAPPAEATPPGNPPKDAPPQENPVPEVKPSPEAKDREPKDVEEIHMVHHYPENYVYREHWNNILGYQYTCSPTQENLYSGREAYGDDYHHYQGGGDRNNINSVFSDENPNACSIA